MAHKKAAGTAKNLRDSAGRRLGIKLFAGQTVENGNIICRQRGTKWRSGEGTKIGKDHTIYAITTGFVTFQVKKRLRFDGQKHVYTYIHVVSEDPNKKGVSAKKVAAPKKTEAAKVAESKTEEKAASKKTTAKKASTTKEATTK